MAFTVTATGGGSVLAQGIGLRVMVLTQAVAASSQTGATASAQTPSISYQAAITPTQTGSRVYGAIISDPVLTANAASTLIDNTPGPSGVNFASVKATATSTSGTPETIGSATAAGADGGIAIAEILTTGTLTEDASGPAYVKSTTVHTITTASFTPPAGSLLVALPVHICTTNTMTDTSGLGLTWVKLVEITTDGYAGVWVAQMPAGGSSVSLTTPNLALAAPLLAISGGGTVALTAPNVALAAPLVTPSGGTPASVSLTAPNLALAAPLLSPGGGGTVALTAPNIALAAPLVTPSAGSGGTVALNTPNISLAAPLVTLAGGGTVALTTPNISLAAPLLEIPAAGSPLIISLATQAGTDDYGNTFPEGLSVGAPGGQQAQLVLSGTEGLTKFPTGQSIEGTAANVTTGISGSGTLEDIQLLISGPNLNVTGATDWVQLQLTSANDGATAAAGMFLNYIDTSASVHLYASISASGFIGIGTMFAVAPGGTTASPAALETWHSLGTGMGASWTVNNTRYRITPDGECEIDIAVNAQSGGGSSGTFTFANTLPAAYQFSGNYSRSYGLSYNGNVVTSDLFPSILVDGSGTSHPGRVRILVPALAATTNVGGTVRIPLS